MSENISLPAARVPMVDGDGMITREWLTLLAGMFRRVGGPVGFSNSELYGDAVSLQSYDELLERISSLEAQNRSLGQVVQMMALGLVPSLDGPSVASGNVFDELTVKGNTQLAIDRGVVAVGEKVPGSLAKLQVGGNVEVVGTTKLGGTLETSGNASVTGNVYATQSVYANTSVISEAFLVGDTQVVGGRVPGIAEYTSYLGQTVGATYAQAQVQATDNALKTASDKLAQVVTALRSHGLIGD